ncbi:MAG: hypothetical protein ACL7BU_00295 [Candidatus Phlomobacter fragariae]
MKFFIRIICLCLFLINCKENTVTSITIQPVLTTENLEEAQMDWPTIGYDLKVKL